MRTSSTLRGRATAPGLLALALCVCACGQTGGGTATAGTTGPSASAPPGTASSSGGNQAANPRKDKQGGVDRDGPTEAESPAASGAGSNRAQNSASPPATGNPPPSDSSGPATPSPTPKFAAQPYTQGDVLKVMPDGCVGRVYVNVAGLAAGIDAATLDGALEKFLSAEGGADSQKDIERLKAGLKVAKDGGLDASKVREIAVCLQKRDSESVFALGMDLGGAKDALATLAKTFAAFKGRDREKPIVEKGGVRFLEMSDPVAEAAPNVLAFLDSDRALASLSGGGAAGFDAAKKHLAWADVREDVDEHFALVIDEAADRLDVRVTALPDGREGRELRDKPDEYLKKLNEFLGGMAQQFASTSLSAVAEKLKLVKVAVENGEIVATLALPKADFGGVVKAIAHAKLEDFAALGGGRKRSEPARPAKTPSTASRDATH